MLLNSVIFLLCTVSVSSLIQLEDDDDVIQETLKIMLDFHKVPRDVPPPMKEPSYHVSEYMSKLYEEFINADGSNDGNTVRIVEPSVGKIDGQEVIMFDVSHFGAEKLQRGEIHFHLRRGKSAKRRARSLSARALCSNDYCTEAQYLHHITPVDGAVVWDATKVLVETNALGGKQLIVRINRRDVKMRTYSEMVRRASPFLLIFSNGENEIDGERVRREVEGTRRKRREAKTNYYSYLAEDSSTPSEKSQREMEELKKQATDYIREKNITQIKAKKIRAHRKKKARKDDIWNGFGEDIDEESEDGENEETQTSNDIRVVLMEQEKKEKMCSRKTLTVDIAGLGWDKFVMSPTTFEAGLCSGECDYPLSKKSKPSNHATLQSLLLPKTHKICCAPSQMESLTILYRDEFGRFTIKNFADMIVTECSCL